MKETHRPRRLPVGSRPAIQRRLARIALLLVLPAAGLGLAGADGDPRTARLAGAGKMAAAAARDCRGRSPVPIAPGDPGPSRYHSYPSPPAPGPAGARLRTRRSRGQSLEPWGIAGRRSGGVDLLLRLPLRFLRSAAFRRQQGPAALPRGWCAGGRHQCRPSGIDAATVSAIRPVRLPGPFGSRKQGGTSLPACRQDGTMADILRHGTFVIDREGTVQWVNVGDAPFRRNPALLYQLARMEGRLPAAKPVSRRRERRRDAGAIRLDACRRSAAVRKVFCVPRSLALACAWCAQEQHLSGFGQGDVQGLPAAGAVVFFRRRAATRAPTHDHGRRREDGSFELVCGSRGRAAPARRLRCADRMEASHRPGQAGGPRPVPTS